MRLCFSVVDMEDCKWPVPRVDYLGFHLLKSEVTRDGIQDVNFFLFMTSQLGVPEFQCWFS